MDGFPFNWKSFLAQLFSLSFFLCSPFSLAIPLMEEFFFHVLLLRMRRKWDEFLRDCAHLLPPLGSPASFFLLPLLIPHPRQDQQTIKQTDRHTLTGLEKNDIFLCCTSNGANSSEKNTRPHIIIIIGVKKTVFSIVG